MSLTTTYWLESFLYDCDCFGFLSFEDFCNLRLVSRQWDRLCVASCRSLWKDLFKLHMTKRLEYDKQIYDQQYRPRELIRGHLDEIIHLYDNNYIPVTEIIEDDLFMGDDIVDIISDKLVEEFRMFLEIYREYPNTKVEIYSPAFLSRIAGNQLTKAKEIVISGDSLKNLVYFHPFCYSKHYKCAADDLQFINVLCYVNIMDPDVSVDFGDYDERFYVITIDMDDLQDSEAHHDMVYDRIRHLTNNILKSFDYLEVITLHTFVKAYDLLVNNQKFNI